jgi:HEAT repeat protein
VMEILLKLSNGHPDFTDDLRFQYFYLNRLKWTESIVQMLAELEDEFHILRIIRLALDVDLRLGARLAGSVQPQFQIKTVEMIYALEISDRERVDLLGLTRSDAAIPGLINAIDRGCYQHYGHALNIQAVRILGSFGNESTIPGLVKAIQDRDFEVRESAAASLEKIGGDLVVTSLLEALDREGEYVRKDIIKTLVKLGNTIAIPALINAFENDVSDGRDVAVEAAKALGNLGAIAAVPALIHTLEDEIYYDVYVNAIEALGKIGGEDAIAALTRSLEKEHLRSYALQALGRTVNIIAIPAVIKDLTDRDYHTRCQAVATLKEIGGESEIPVLIDILKTDENSTVRTWAVDAIASLMKDRLSSVIHSLIGALQDRSDSVRKSVVEILGELGDPIFIHNLINALSDEHYSVRISAAKALVKFDNEIAISSLINSLTDRNWWVRYYSIQALEKFSDRTVIQDALIGIISDLTPSVGITTAAVQTLKARSVHTLGFYNYEIEKLNLE